MNPLQRLGLAVVILLACAAAGARTAWVWQANAFGKQLASQAKDYDRQLAEKDQANSREREAAAAAAMQLLAEHQAERHTLELRLQEQGQKHWKEMKDAEEAQARLRDRLATADVRLSVLVDAGSIAASRCDGGVREAAGTGSLVHAAVRAQLDPAHAQRIIAITDEGDRGLIALRACQAYVREVIK
jgi:hypothetical protein